MAFKSIMEIINDFHFDTVEKFTRGIRNINTDHGYIHDNMGFEFFLKFNEVTGETNYKMVIPSGKDLHFKNIVLSGHSGTCLVTIRRERGDNDITIATETTTISELTGPYNLNDYGDDSEVVMTKVTAFDSGDDGEAWKFIQIPGNSTNQSVTIASMFTGDNQENIFKAGSTYIIRVEKVGSDSPKDVLISAFWYEEPKMG